MTSMETADREQLLRFLNASRKKLIESSEGLTDEQAKMRPAEDRWSVLECVEHTALVEDGMFGTLSTKMVPAEAEHDRNREQQFIRGTADRSRKIDAPDGVRPAGKFATLADALAHFESSRARTIDYISKCDLDLRGQTISHPRLGVLSGQEFMIILALHPSRHALQILETREALGLD
jgi:uncharacterized damage-inducible protein DinB